MEISKYITNPFLRKVKWVACVKPSRTFRIRCAPPSNQPSNWVSHTGKHGHSFHGREGVGLGLHTNMQY